MQDTPVILFDLLPWYLLARTECNHEQSQNSQIRSKDSQVKTQLVLWIFILFKVTR